MEFGKILDLIQDSLWILKNPAVYDVFYILKDGTEIEGSTIAFREQNTNMSISDF